MPDLFVPNEDQTKCVPSPRIASSNPPPVFFLPGFLASGLRARRTREEEDSLKDACSLVKGDEWVRVWPPALKTLPKLCFAKILTVQTLEGRAYDALGWELDVVPSNPLIDRGLVYGKIRKLFARLRWSLEFVPYDWRYAPGSVTFDDVFVSRLRQKIEDTGTPVALVGHSFGAAVAYEFLSKMTKEWKAKHVQLYVPISAPFGGAVGTVISTVAGYALDVPIPDFVRRKVLFPVQSAAPSGAYLMPVPGAFNIETPIATTKTNAYEVSVDDYRRMYDDLGLGDAKEQFEHMRRASVLWTTFSSPMTSGTIHVIWSTYGDDSTTPEAVTFGNDFDVHGADPGNPIRTKGCVGDGTVPRFSLERFREWEKNKPSDLIVKSTHFEGVEHKAIVSDKSVLSKLAGVLAGVP